jgi:multidrug efflux pump subunit AcrA (membrane-fusion protein)
MTASSTKKRSRRRWYWILGVVALLIIAFFTVPFFLGDRVPGLGNSNATRKGVETLTANPQPYLRTVTGSGTLQAVQSRDLAPEVTGVVATVVEAGTRVKAGDVLVQLDTDTSLPSSKPRPSVTAPPAAKPIAT